MDSPSSSDDDAPTVLKRFDRQINMYCEKKFLYRADSVLVVQDRAVLDMIEKDKAGIGQIFWYGTWKMLLDFSNKKLNSTLKPGHCKKYQTSNCIRSDGMATKKVEASGETIAWA